MSFGIFGDSLWAFVLVGGVLILAAALAWAKFNNKVTPQQDARTEQATHDLYEDGTTDDGRPS